MEPLITKCKVEGCWNACEEYGSPYCNKHKEEKE